MSKGVVSAVGRRRVLDASSGHAGAASGPREEGQSERDAARAAIQNQLSAWSVLGVLNAAVPDVVAIGARGHLLPVRR
jgi:hypothetical protein